MTQALCSQLGSFYSVHLDWNPKGKRVSDGVGDTGIQPTLDPTRQEKIHLEKWQHFVLQGKTPWPLEIDPHPIRPPQESQNFHFKGHIYCLMLKEEDDWQEGNFYSILRL